MVASIIASIALRVACAFAPGYVHPDEWFQSNEVMASDVFGHSTRVPWEYAGDVAPARSVVSAYLSSGVAYAACARVGIEGSARVVAYAPRVITCVASCVVDLSVRACARELGVDARRAGWFAATSWVTLVLLVRPFSNAWETFALAACALAAASDCDAIIRCALVGAIGMLGVFIRFTSAVYIAPWALFAVLKARKVSVVAGAFGAFAGVAAAAATATACVVVDTAYFKKLKLSDDALWVPSNWVITPWNSLAYNSKTENLSEHGLHPRWLHAAVNGPMMFGPLWIVLMFRLLRGRIASGGVGPRRTPTKSPALLYVLWATVLLPLVALSLAPHQEPRFLAPMLVPVCVLSALYVQNEDADETKKKKTNRRFFFYALWIVFNALLAALFGVLHQGGVTSSVRALSALQPTTASARALFWKTYTPPRSLLAQKRNHERIHIIDLAGAPASDVRQALLESFAAGSSARCEDADDACPSVTIDATFLIAPPHDVDQHLQPLLTGEFTIERVHSKGPHVSLDSSDVLRYPLERSRLDTFRVSARATTKTTTTTQSSESVP
jgi:phosphatidylinositol glycan class Z